MTKFGKGGCNSDFFSPQTPMSSKYSIYAAPRTKHGAYRFCDDKPIYRQNFDSLDTMRKFWNDSVLPQTFSKSGSAYELAMIVGADGFELGSS